MNAFLKASCIVIYLLGILAALGLLPASLGVLATVALVLLAAHVLEAVAMFRYVKLYPGGLAASIVLTLLFGLLHWLPLAKAARAGDTARAVE